MKASLENGAPHEVTGLASTDEDVLHRRSPSPDDFTYRVYRFSHELDQPSKFGARSDGCAAKMDVKALTESVRLLNARHPVRKLDRDGIGQGNREAANYAR